MPYFGANITRDDSWMLEIAHIPHDMREEEAALRASCWFDYRDLLPAQATYLFRSRYEEIGREFYGQTRDYREAHGVKMIQGEDIFDSPEIVTLWKARQAADRVGCKYDFYLRQVFKRFWDRGHRFFPRPNQMYSEEIELDIADAWAVEKKCSLQLATSERFKNKFYVGHPDQDAYHSYLVEQINDREQKHMIIGRLVFKEQCLPVEVAGEKFGADAVRRAYCLYQS